MPANNFIDLTGMEFGRWKVISQSSNKGRQATWKCECKCGEIKDVVSYSLRKGISKSCGCLRNEIVPLSKTKHGHNKKSGPTKEYNVWSGMLNRCKNSNDRNYVNYGLRGIRVCERWHDFSNFFEDMGYAPTSKHSIERIDVNGNYEPSNCKWATATEQARNKRVGKNNTSGVSGVEWDKTSGKWRARISANKKKFSLGLFNNIEDAIRARRQGEIDFWS